MKKLKEIKHNFGKHVIIYDGAQIDESVEIGPFTIIFPNVIIKKNVVIASSCIIGKPPSVGKNQMALCDLKDLTILDENIYVGDQSIIYSGVKVGSNSYLADRSFLRENAVIENDVVIGTGAVISFNAHIGSRSKIMTGSNIAGNMIIGKDSFIGVHVCSVTDNNPFANDPRNLHKGPVIGNKVFIGSNVSLLPGINIVDKITVGAGSVVTKDLLESNSIYMGIPAKKIITKN